MVVHTRLDTRQIMSELKRIILETVDAYNAAYLFLGHGSSNQIKDIGAALRHLDLIIVNCNRKYGEKKWLAIYGGDRADPEKPDIGLLMQYLSQKGVDTAAIQSDYVIKACDSPLDDFVSHKFYYPADFQYDKVKWGGVDPPDRLRGATRYYLSNELIQSPRFKGLIVFGGGLIAKQEIQYAMSKSVPVHYIPTAVRNRTDESGEFGQVHELFVNRDS